MDAIETQAVNLAMGRIFKMLSRLEQPGDIADYERCRSLIFDFIEAPPDRAPCYARDYRLGAQGD